MSEKQMLIDTSLCTACRGCMVACKQWWGLSAEKTENTGSYENPPDLSQDTWTRVEFTEKIADGTMRWYFFKNGCRHCKYPGCMIACPLQAIEKKESGAVVVDWTKCNGCCNGECFEACPFGIPRFLMENEEKKLRIFKCMFCFDRLEKGEVPACAKTCLSGAIQFGERPEILLKAKDRLEKLRTAYPDANLYPHIAYPDANLYPGEEYNVIWLLLDKPDVYKLALAPAHPERRTTIKRAFTKVVKPLTVFGIAAGVINALEKSSDSQKV